MIFRTLEKMRIQASENPRLQGLKPAFRVFKKLVRFSILPVVWLIQTLVKFVVAPARAYVRRLPYPVKFCLRFMVRPRRVAVHAYCFLRDEFGPLLSRKYRQSRDLFHFLRRCLALWLLGRRRIPRSAAVAEGERPLIVMLVCSSLPVDPRVEREAKVLVRNGFRVKILCPRWSPPSPAPHWGPGITIKLLPEQARGSEDRFPYLVPDALFKAALVEEPWAYHAHDLDTALPALMAAARKRVPCVCDFHEWYSENVSYDFQRGVYHPHHWSKRYIYQMMERLVMRCASEVITVCDSIGTALAQQYRSSRKVAIIRNIPPITEASASQRPKTDLRARLGIPSSKRIVLYQGGVGPSRNLEPVIRAMGQVPNAVFVIRGPSIEFFEKAYLKLATESGAAGRVFCLPAVPSARVVAEARAADLGLWTLLANVGLNFKYSLPNKVFEYLAAGLPVLGADLPEVRRLVMGHRVGLCFDPEDPSSIAAAINRLVEDEPFRRATCDNIAGTLNDLQADREWAKLANLYIRMQEPVSTEIPLPQTAIFASQLASPKASAVNSALEKVN